MCMVELSALKIERSKQSGHVCFLASKSATFPVVREADCISVFFFYRFLVRRPVIQLRDAQKKKKCLLTYLSG